uniref:Uncharacterized protein n=1 Tax=Anguilla anguilla TaxID=7936 RepID=A0A0E9PG20_ANGAN
MCMCDTHRISLLLAARIPCGFRIVDIQLQDQTFII